MNFSFIQPVRPALAPAAILLITALAHATDLRLPHSLAGLTLIGPYVVLLLGAAIAIWFNRGRAFIALASLLAAYAAYTLARDFVGPASFAVRAVYTALAVLAPLNILLALLFPERGVNQHRNYRWLMLGAAEIAAVAWIAAAGNSDFSGTAWHDMLDFWLLRSPPTPIAGRIVFLAAFIAAMVRAWPDALSPEWPPLEVGIVGALAALFFACEWVTSPGAFGSFMAAAGVILLVAVLQESHRLAFRDKLTSLPGRRALDERLSGLGPAYTVAMIDVDHFKKFNDTHGHDIGDQVLKLVAARLAEIEGDGVAYRYGGEEFCVLFDGIPMKEALPHLETLRGEIERYRMTVRSTARPQDMETGSQFRARQKMEIATEKVLSVTVSIGVAESGRALASPEQTIRAADEALYRAKDGGRNRVSK